MRPGLLSAQGESIAQAVQREARGVRAGVGVDASLSRKIEVTGPDATNSPIASTSTTSPGSRTAASATG